MINGGAILGIVLLIIFFYMLIGFIIVKILLDIKESQMAFAGAILWPLTFLFYLVNAFADVMMYIWKGEYK